MANYLTGTSIGDEAKAQADAQAQASLNRRRSMASNALVTAYGPQAADPEAWNTAVGASTNALEAPAKVADAYTTQNANALKLDAAKRADTAKQGQAVVKSIQDQVDAGVDPGEALDSVSHYLPALGVDQANYAAVRDVLVKDPKGLLAHLTAGLADAGADSKIKGSPIYTKDANGKVTVGFATATGGFKPIDLPAGQEPAPQVTGAGTLVELPDGTQGVVKTDRFGKAVVTPLPGKSIPAATAKENADANAYRAAHPGVIVTPGVDSGGVPTSIITDRGTGAQRTSNPGAAPAPAVDAADKAAAVAQKNAAAFDAVSTTYGRTSAIPMAVDQAAALVNHMATNPVVRKFNAHVPGTAEYQFEQMHKQIGTNLSLDDLRNLRASGTSLGRVTNAEFNAASQAYANMDLGQPLSIIKGNLNRVKGVYGNINANLKSESVRLKNATARLPAAAPNAGWSVVGVK